MPDDSDSIISGTIINDSGSSAQVIPGGLQSIYVTGGLTGGTITAPGGTISIGSNSVGGTVIQDTTVTLGKIQHIAGTSLLGKSTATSGLVESIPIGGGLSFVGGTLVSSTTLGANGSIAVTGGLTGGTFGIVPGGTISIGSNAIGGTVIQDTTITSGKLGVDSVITSKIQDTTITEAKLGVDSVTTIKIQDTTITLPKIQQIGATTILGNPLTTAGTVTSIVLGTTFTISGSTLNSLGGGGGGGGPSTAAGTSLLGNTSTAAGTVSSVGIGSNLTFSAGTLSANNQIGTIAIIGGLTGGTFTTSPGGTIGLGSNSIGGSVIQDTSIITSKLADASVTFAKIQNLAATSILGRNSTVAGVASDIAIGSGLTLSGGTLTASGGAGGTIAVTGGLTGGTFAISPGGTISLGSNSVGGTVIQDTTITTGKLANASVTTAKIQDTTVTLAKLQIIASSTILGNTNSVSNVPVELTRFKVGELLKFVNYTSGSSFGLGAGTTVLTTSDAGIVYTKDAGGGVRAVTLPSSVGNSGFNYIISRTQGGDVIISGSGTDTINGSSSLTLSEPNQTVVIGCLSDGIYRVIASHNGGVYSITTGGGLVVGTITSTGAISLGSNSVGGTVIQDTTVTSGKIADSAITASKIQDTTITFAKLQHVSLGDVLVGRSSTAAGTVTTIHVVNPLTIVSGTNLTVGSNVIGGTSIQDTTITTGKLADASITTLKIQDTTVTLAKIQHIAGTSLLGKADATSGLVTSIPIGGGLSFVGGTLVSSTTAGGGVSAIEFAGGLTGGVVTTTGTVSLGSNAISGTVIQDTSVTANKLADNSVTTSKIQDTTVTFGKIQNIAGTSLLGKADATSGLVTSIPIGGGLSFVGGTLVSSTTAGGGVSAIEFAGGLTGGVVTTTGTVSLGSNAISGTVIQDTSITGGKLEDTTVTYSKMQTVAARRLLGNTSTSETQISAIEVSSLKTFLGLLNNTVPTYLTTNTELTTAADGIVQWVSTGTGTITVTLPSWGPSPYGLNYPILKGDGGAGTVIIAASSGEFINNGQTAVIITRQNHCMILGISTPYGTEVTNYQVIAEYNPANISRLVTGSGLIASTITGTGFIGLGSNSIGGTSIQGTTITSGKLADNSVVTAKIQDTTVTLAKIQHIAGTSLLGKADAASGLVTAIPIGGGLSFSGGTLVSATTAPADGSIAVTGGLTGGTFGVVPGGTIGLGSNAIGGTVIQDTTITTGKLADASITTLKIQDTTVTLGKIQHIAGTSLLGKADAASGLVTSIPIGGGLSFSGGTLVSATTAGGGVSAIEFAGGLTGGVVTTTGTVSLGSNAIGGTVIQDTSITGGKLADATVTLAKIGGITGPVLLGRESTASGTAVTIAIGSNLTLSGGTLSATGGGGGGTRTAGISISGGGTVLSTGAIATYVTLPNAGTFSGWRLTADTTGSVVVSVRKDTYANFPPTVADTISGTSPPTITASNKAEATSFGADWTTTFSAGDILAFNIDSCSTITALTLTLFYR